MATATIKSIAAACGVSNPVVSKVLNGGRSNVGVSPSTRQRVEAAAARLGYRPHAGASATRTGRFRTLTLVGVFSPNTGLGELPDGVLSGIEKAASERGQHLVIARTNEKPTSGAAAPPPALAQRSTDGLLVVRRKPLNDAVREELKRQRLPIIWVGEVQPYDAVYADADGAMRRLVRELLAMGHSRIAFARYESSDLHDMQSTYEQVMAAAGLSPRVIKGVGTARHVEPGSDRGEVLPYWREQFSSAERPTALITTTPRVATPAAVAAMTTGLTLGEGLTLTTVHDVIANDIGIPIATLGIPAGGLGRGSVEMLLERIDSGTAEPTPSRVLPFRFDQGQTFGPPSA